MGVHREGAMSAAALGMVLLMVVWPSPASAGEADAVDFSRGFARACAARYPVADASAERLAREIGIPARVAWAVAVVESGCNATLRGASGEIGLGQVIPRDQTRYPTSWFNDRPSSTELLDPVINVRTILYVLERNARLFCGRQLDCALAVYNGGTRPGARAWRYANRVLWLAATEASTSSGGEKNHVE